MNARPSTRLTVLGSLLCAMVSAPTAMAAGPVVNTEIDDIVMYAVESSDPARLVRYFFRSDTFVAIGEVWATDGRPVDDVEALSYVGQGPYKGLYGVATDGPTEQHLARINPLTAEAYVYGPNLGGSKIIGMIPDYDPVLGEWWLLASDAGGKLRRINVTDGNASTLANVGEDFEGLARDADGVIYANTNEDLYRLDPIGSGASTDYDVVHVGPMGLDKAESLEFAFGNQAPPVDVPGVSDTWTTSGVLFVFDDDTDRFGILNPSTGEFEEYLVNGLPCAFSNEDAEGMIFVTTLQDPLYGSIDGFD